MLRGSPKIIYLGSNTQKRVQNGHSVAMDIIRSIFLNVGGCILIQVLPTFISNASVNDNSTLFRLGAKSETAMVLFISTYI